MSRYSLSYAKTILSKIIRELCDCNPFKNEDVFAFFFAFFFFAALIFLFLLFYILMFM